MSFLLGYEMGGMSVKVCTAKNQYIFSSTHIKVTP